MRFGTLKLENFKSFYGTAQIDLDRKPGLYFVTGDNQHDPRLGANGAGKSTIFDALCWALYGKSLRGLKAAKLRSWNAPASEGYKVSLSFSIGDQDYEVIRQWNAAKNNRLVLKGGIFDRELTQDELESVISMSYGSFCHAVVVGQFGTSLIDLPPSDKLSLLTSVLELDRWIDYSETASSLSTAVDNEIRGKENKLSYYVGKISSLKEKQKELEIEVERRKERLRKAIEEKKEAIEEQTDKIAAIEVALKDLAAEEKKKRKRLEGAKKDRIELEKALERTVAEYAQLDTFIKVDKEKAEELGELIERFNNAIQLPNCPYCNQRISPDHIAKELTRLSKELGDLKLQMADRVNRKSKIGKKINEAKEVIRDIKETEQGILSEIMEVENKQKMLRYDLKETRRLIKKMEDEILSIEEELSKSDEIILKGKNEIAKMEKAISELEESLSELKRKRELYKFWVKGFKHVRLFLLEEALTMLELETNNMLSALGLVDWTVTYEVKGTGSSRGIKVSILRPGHKSGISWESWSGGETQRIRLASTLAFANIVAARSGISPSMIALDEPTHHLDADGISDLIEALKTFASEQQKAVWLIDHHTLDFGGFDGVIKVVKDEDGVSHLEELGEV